MAKRFKQYKRKGIESYAEMRPVTTEDINNYVPELEAIKTATLTIWCSTIGDRPDAPELGDMIVRNPNNHKDQWLMQKEIYQAEYANN